MASLYGECLVCGKEQDISAYVTANGEESCQFVGCCIPCDNCKKKQEQLNQKTCVDCGATLASSYPFSDNYQDKCLMCGELAHKRDELRKTAHTEKLLKSVKSAKAKSVIDLANAPKKGLINGRYNTQREVLVYPVVSETTVSEFFKNIQSRGDNIFARPAPLNPVHGFFDSRVVKDMWELRKLSYEIWSKKAKEEILEIILMPQVRNPVFSGIVTPSGVTFGRGNDGATNGKTAITIRTPQSVLSEIVGKELQNKYTKEGESTFVEIVVSEDKHLAPQVVQIRSGNEPSSGGNDFIPYNVVIKNVYNVTDQTDLVEWQKLVSSFTEGDVIHAESLACHGAVHGVLHNIPVITTFVPQVGEKLTAGKITPLNFERVGNLLCGLFAKPEEYKSELALYGWKSLHVTATNMQAGGEEIITFALFYTLLGGMAACLGEYGHAKGKIKKGFDRKGSNRESVFQCVFADKHRALQALFVAWRAFLDKTRWSSKSYGGPKWADCTEHTARLAHKLGRFIKLSSEDNLKAALEQANNLAHCMHNGGLLFTKFGDCSSENIGDIFAQRRVLEKLLSLKEQGVNAQTREEFTFLKTLLRRPPKSLVMFQDIEARKAQKKEKEMFAKVKASIAFLLKEETFKLQPYVDYYGYGGSSDSYLKLSLVVKNQTIFKDLMVDISYQNVDVKKFEGGVQLKSNQISLVAFDIEEESYVSMNFAVNHDGQEFNFHFTLQPSKILEKIYDKFCASAEEKQISQVSEENVYDDDEEEEDFDEEEESYDDEEEEEGLDEEED